MAQNPIQLISAEEGLSLYGDQLLEGGVYSTTCYISLPTVTASQQQQHSSNEEDFMAADFDPDTKQEILTDIVEPKYTSLS